MNILEKPRVSYGKDSKTRSVETNAIKCCLGHLVICVEVLSLLPPLSPSTPDTNGAGECGVRTAARRADRRPDDDGEGRERRQAEAEAHAHVTQPLPLPPSAAAAGRQIGRETSSSVGARRSPGRGLACSKQQTTTTTTNNSIRSRRWSSSGGKRATETVQDVRAAE